MRKVLAGRVAAVALALGLAATPALAQQQNPMTLSNPVRGFQAGDILVRGRVLVVAPENGGHTDIGGRPGASTTATPEVDLSYFILPQLSVELIAGTTYHDLTLRNSAIGNVDLGHTWLLPPTLTLQYHPLPRERFSPYVGVGVNYSIFYGQGGTRTPPVNRVAIDNTWSLALNAGLNYEINDRWVANLDLKRLFLEPNVSVNSGTIRGRVDLNPWIVGIGIGYRF
ncbi:outer membrane beta-barrel protein [Roseomonas sp. NAR14]|uniref:Outer membrane beta-barrel protein n=1 Tax=Roseomonas acroporae TaxID=2937791 RepID=A0A9X2BVB9_9PROT|nr:OmpW family outer membrane protein [Roseomonas acroporae]MCK8786508.1 outer membrane beta-barrel protein [Roseomonas acroporae]